MTTTALLEALRAKGLILLLDGDRLKYRVPIDLFTQELLQHLADHKEDLLQALREEIPSTPQTPVVTDTVAPVVPRQSTRPKGPGKTNLKSRYLTAPSFKEMMERRQREEERTREIDSNNSILS
jgi:hypothetical protein